MSVSVSASVNVTFWKKCQIKYTIREREGKR